MRIYVRSRDCSEEADCGFDACGFLELDERCAREAAKSRRLLSGRAKAARCDGIPVGIEVDLERLHISPC